MVFNPSIDPVRHRRSFLPSFLCYLISQRNSTIIFRLPLIRSGRLRLFPAKGAMQAFAYRASGWIGKKILTILRLVIISTSDLNSRGSREDA